MHLRLNRKSPLPIHIQLKAQLAHLIRGGEWLPGRRLPTVRQLAGSLRINRNTASRGFADLAREGHLSCERGRGTFGSPRRAGGGRERAGGRPPPPMIASGGCSDMSPSWIGRGARCCDVGSPEAHGGTVDPMALLKGNLHTHTHLSDGLFSPEAVIARYRQLGYDFLAITDHDDRIGEDYWQRIPRGGGGPPVFVGGGVDYP